MDKERKKLQEARQRVQEQRQLLQNYDDGKKPFTFHNDKVYMRYEPYHVFENKEDRISDSFVLPVPEPRYPKPVKSKIRIKFVPLPLEEDLSHWERYNEEMIEEEKDADETIQAFLNLTARHKNRKKVRNIHFVPRCLSDDVGLDLSDRKKKKVKMKVGFDTNDFKDTYPLPILYNTYRPVDRRNQDYRYGQKNYGSVSKSMKDFKSSRRRRGILNLPVDFSRKKPTEKLKVKFVPVEVQNDKTWKNKTW